MPVPDVIVFVGPSLPRARVEAILPGCGVLPPVRCGDVLAALRLAPSTLVIIDGYFERTAAVWHKELLVALERGVRVIGGASMGALRAAELADLGMEGAGEIAAAYRRGELTDDDEVAVAHAHDFRALSDALVNLRATIAAAVRAGVVDAASGAAVVAAAKASFYPERTLEAAAAAALAERATSRALVEWARGGGYVDQKALDAEAALVAATRPRPRTGAIAAPRFAGLRALLRDVACRPFGRDEPWLPEHERVLLTARFLPGYAATRRVAQLLAVVSAVLGVPVEGVLERVARSPRARDAERRVELAITLLDAPREDAAALDATGRAAVDCAARLWHLLDEAMRARGLAPAVRDVRGAAIRFRRKAHLLDRAAIDAWLADHALEVRDFDALARLWACWHRVVEQHALDAFEVTGADERTFWLLEAARRSGLYEDARALLLGEAPLPLEHLDDDRARARDFMDATDHDAARARLRAAAGGRA